jgi:hypothetical protein
VYDPGSWGPAEAGVLVRGHGAWPDEPPDASS